MKKELTKKDVDAWQANIEEAKALLKDRKASQMKIAQLALEVCEITWGGGRKLEGRSLGDFAKEIGVQNKTLSSWVCIKRNLYDKLSPDLKLKSRVGDLFLAAKGLPSNCSVEEANKSVGEIVYNSGPDRRMLSLISQLKSLYSNMSKETVVMLCKKEILQQIKFYCEQILVEIDKNSDQPITAEDHGLREVRSVSASSGLGISRVWRMKPNDKLILDYMKKKKTFLSPVFLGTQLFTDVTKTAAKLRTLRSLNKLREMGHVTRDNKGLYKFKNLRTV